MVKKFLKYSFYLILAFCAYKALDIYVLYGIGQKLIGECGASREAVVELKKRQAPSAEFEKYMHDKFSCLKEKQNFLENFLYPVPEQWVNPPPGSLNYDKILKNNRD